MKFNYLTEMANFGYYKKVHKIQSACNLLNHRSNNKIKYSSI